MHYTHYIHGSVVWTAKLMLLRLQLVEKKKKLAASKCRNGEYIFIKKNIKIKEKKNKNSMR